MSPPFEPTRVLAVVLAIACASCQPRERRTPDDTLVVLIETPVGTLDPRYTQTNYDTKFSRIVAPGLIVTDTEDLSARPELAEAIVQLDELTWEVTLRADARFSDGTPVTSDDVAWTYRTMMEGGADSPYAKPFRERFTSIEVVDPRRVRFHLVGPLATFMTDIDVGIVAKHAAGPDGRFPGGRVIGAGPYRMVSLGSTELVLEANPTYFGEHPRVPRVQVRTVRDATARIVMLVGGSADLAQNSARYDLLDDIAAQPRVTLASAPSALLSYLLFNNDDPVLKDVRIRRAIALAIDRPAIIAAKYGGRAVLATTLLPPTHWAYEPDVTRWDHDPARARALLDEAGYPDPPGPAPRLHLVYKTSSDQFRVALARVIAAQLATVGIEVEVRPFEFGTFLNDLKKGQFQLASIQTTDIGEPDFYRTYFASSRIPSPKDMNAQNRMRYRNPRVDELVERGRRVVDRDERKRIYAEVQRILADDVPFVPLWHDDNVVLTNKSVTGYRILPNARFNGLVSAVKR